MLLQTCLNGNFELPLLHREVLWSGLCNHFWLIIYFLRENFGLLGSGERCWYTMWTCYYTHTEELQCVKWFYWERTCTSFPWDFGHASFQALPNQTWPCVLLLWWVLALYTTKNLENLPKHFSRTEWQKLSQIVSFAIFSYNLKIRTFITDNICCIFVIRLLSYICCTYHIWFLRTHYKINKEEQNWYIRMMCNNIGYVQNKVIIFFKI